MIAVQGQRGARTVSPATMLDRLSSADPSAALPRVGRDMLVMYPARCDTGYILEDAAPDAIRGS